jgi:ABC-type branched-subunit amino acid transport system substrate-binding protein
LKDIPAAKEFFEAYRQETGRVPGEEAGIAAEAVSVWASAVRATNSLERTVVAPAIRGKIVKDTNFGNVEFSENGQMLTKPSLFRVMDGPAWRLELVK